jgi:hypothetical protein
MAFYHPSAPVSINPAKACRLNYIICVHQSYALLDQSRPDCVSGRDWPRRLIPISLTHVSRQLCGGQLNKGETYRIKMPFLFAIATWLLSIASCVLLNFVPSIVPKTAAKSADAMGEISDVMFEKVVSSSGIDAS